MAGTVFADDTTPGRIGRTFRRARQPTAWSTAALVLAALVSLPVLVVASRIFVDTEGVWEHIATTVLPDYITNTLLLMVGVGTLAAACGVGAAWLVTMYRFPGVRIFEWALLLPLAVPAYVLAYVYTELFEYAGPVQTLLRDLFGWGHGDYWFPRIRSLEGAVVVFALTLYPYVYMLARAAFMEQSICALEVSRTLGRGPWRSFRDVALPLARPAIAAGTALVLMETISDYGTVYHFGVPTFTTGIYRAWFGMGEPVVAAQLAASMLVFVTVLVAAERFARGRQRFHHTTRRYQPIRRRPLGPMGAAIAVAVCVLPVALGFALPGAVLLQHAITQGDPHWGPRFFAYATNSFTLAAITALVAVAAAVVLAYAVRQNAGPLTRIAGRIAALGYAVPGSVIAVGVLIPFAGLDNAVDRFARDTFGISTGLVLTGTIAALVYAYLVRFLAVSVNTVEASLTKISTTMDHAARTLGAGPRETLVRVHAPIMRGSLLTAGLLVFVDVMKELPATMILRPFNFDTLAIRTYRLASDERLAEASTSALTIVLVGILPVILLSLAIARSRPGSRPEAGRAPSRIGSLLRGPGAMARTGATPHATSAE
ncbi:MAG: iron ABC transporter permease [Rhodospirillaceae bacterium]|nr:iron ABC transporter permease [Rhodospirillaceae bacterium]